MRFPYFAVFVWGAAALPAQRTWIVDYDTTKPADFRDIPPAISAAAPGDTILVQNFNVPPYVYSSFVLNKGIAIVATPGGRAEVAATVVVENIPPGQSVVLQSVHGQLCTIRNCLGSVHLISSGFLPSMTQALPSLEIRNCRFVTLAFNGGLLLQDFVDSTVVMNSTGGNGSGLGLRFVPLRATRSRIFLSAASFRGASGDMDASCHVTKPPLHSMELTDCDLHISGPEARVLGGFASSLSCTAVQAPALIAYGNTRIFKHPASSLYGTPQGTYTLTEQYLHDQRALSISPGGTFWTSLRTTRPGAPAFLFASLPSTPTSTPYGPLFLDPSFCVLVATGSTDGFGTLDAQVPLSPQAPFGWPLLFQSALLHQGQVELSAPIVVSMAQINR